MDVRRKPYYENGTIAWIGDIGIGIGIGKITTIPIRMAVHVCIALHCDVMWKGRERGTYLALVSFIA